MNKDIKIKSDEVILMPLLLTLDLFHTSSWCFEQAKYLE